MTTSFKIGMSLIWITFGWIFFGGWIVPAGEYYDLILLGPCVATIIFFFVSLAWS